MNMLVVRTGDDIIVIDAGLMFPEQELLGVDIVIPDITYLKQNKRMVRGIVLTHAHEDHIGAIPYILADLERAYLRHASSRSRSCAKNSKSTACSIRSSCTKSLRDQTTTLGAFQIEYLHVTHSTIDCVALAVRTPRRRHHSHRRFQD